MPRGIGREGERSQSAAKDGDCRTVKGSREKSNNRIEQTEEKSPTRNNNTTNRREKGKKEKMKKGKKEKREKKTQKNGEKPKKRTKNPTGANRCAMRQRDGSETPTLWAARRLKRQARRALAAAQPSTGRAGIPLSARCGGAKDQSGAKTAANSKIRRKTERPFE